MAGKYRITAEFDLQTTVEPDGVRFDSVENEVEDFEDNSYFSGSEVDTSGGSLVFTVEAEDEDAAYEKGEEAVYDGLEVTDYNDLAWLVDNVQISVEVIEEPMTLERAQQILSDLADGHEGEVRAAVEFVFDHLAALTARVDLLVSNVEDEREVVRRLSERLATEQPATEQ